MEYITFDLGEMGEHLRLEKSLHSSKYLIVTNNFEIPGFRLALSEVLTRVGFPVSLFLPMLEA
jgi:hypothetical protein